MILILLIVCIVVFCLFLLMIKPGKNRDYTDFTKKSYAHRGLHDEIIPENSLAAFRAARENGYGVELDVQMTKDKKLVVFHDGTLKRMTGADGYLRDYTYEELQKLHLKDTEEKIPLFADVLEALDGADLVCEIKGDNGNRNYELCQMTYDLLKTYKGTFCMESFSPFLVRWFYKHHPEIIRGQLACNFSTNPDMNSVLKFILGNLMLNFVGKPDFIAYRHKDTDMIGFRLCKRLYHPLLIAWTARGKAEQESAWKKFDSIIFEKNEDLNPTE